MPGPYGRDTMSKVYLVGAGPGDPELITIKGRRILEQADVVFYDRLASAVLLDLAPAHAERVYVGRKQSVRAFTQEEICAMLIERARRGLTVVRLKGGDPFIFGRGGEEAEALAAAGVEFEVIPGVTSAIAVPAFAGIPLTHRDYGSFVAFVTGHQDETRSIEGAVPWDDLARAARDRGTLVLLMATAH